MTPARRSTGFTLAELAIALLIVGLLLASSFIPLSTQLELRNLSETQRTLDQIKEALIGFAIANGRLPCPALGTAASGTTNAGVEQFTTPACTALVGVIPWSTLGVPETDSWGRRFTYRVASVYSDAPGQNTWNTATPGSQTPFLSCTAPTPTPTLSSFALCSLGEIALLTRASNTAGVHSTSALGTGLAAVFLSHGKNGYGAYQSTGALVSGVTANTDEAVNANGGVPTGLPGSGNNFTSYIFYSRPQSSYDSTCSETVTGKPFCEFDDAVAFISSNTMVARMVSAGNLP